MSYKEKVLKKRMMQSSLSKLVEITYADPILSLDERRSVVAGIYMAGSAGCSKKNKLLPENTKNSTLKAQSALMIAFSRKLENSPRVELIDTIVKVSLLASWAFSHPSQFEDMLNSFASDMVSEDMSRSCLSKNFNSVHKVISALRENWGIDKSLDLIRLTSENWAKKYNQR